MAETKLKIRVSERAGIPRRGEVVTIGIPCSRGAIQPVDQLLVVGPDRLPRLCQAKVLKKWVDGSVKWLLLDFEASVGVGESVDYTVAVGDDPTPSTAPVAVRQGSDVWVIETGKATFTIDAHRFRPFLSVRVGDREVLQPEPGGALLTLVDDSQSLAAVESVTLEESGPLRAVVRVAGIFQVPGVRFFCRLHFCRGSSAVRIEYTIHNPAPARHRGGMWDLGDEGGFLFRRLAISFRCMEAGAEIRCVPSPGAERLAFPGTVHVSLYQESSGGENWRSAVHRNRDGRIPMTRCGYICEANGKEAATGRRATPLVWQGKGETGVAVAIPAFWENFPVELACGDGLLDVIPFPGRFPELHELQGGEQKTHEFWIDFAVESEGLAWALHPLAAQAGPEAYHQAGILHDLPGDGDLIDSFGGAAELFSKRESADEYGWRNFGEIYADHEAVYHNGPELFVSHYNNQYDFIAGLYRKAFATGDAMWRRLAADLARHVRDIDIYHTDGDREEYNHGLFWHTDHYIDAGTSAHRSFSREHLKVKPPHQCGGGPGAEHCYTTGLMFHYFQTGNPDFRDAVIALARWELVALAGPQTVLAAVKRGVGSVKSWRTGRSKRRLFPRYPLTRGTGNAITACLEAFEIGGGRWFLNKAEELVRETLHPNDDIESRDLLNAEVAWSYTVLLVAVAKFLDKKSELGETDGAFDHARASLLAYADWMVENEYPYLGKPEILEYPNETWAAQDLRKSVVFYHASRFASSQQKRAAFIERAIFFYETSRVELLTHESSRYARSFALMLQNGWVGARLSKELPVEPEAAAEALGVGGLSTPFLSLGSVAARIVEDLGQVVKETSVSRELAWLRARLNE